MKLKRAPMAETSREIYLTVKTYKTNHTLAQDPASANDPLKPFFLTNPEPKGHSKCIQF